MGSGPDGDPDVAYHSGGLYEVLIGALVFAIVWPLRKRLSRPTATVGAVIGLLAAARFVEFFVRSDSATLALGLETAHWTSLLVMLLAGLGAWFTLSRRKVDGPHRIAERLERITVVATTRSARSHESPRGRHGCQPARKTRVSRTLRPAGRH